jgi:hypothetical protein
MVDGSTSLDRSLEAVRSTVRSCSSLPKEDALGAVTVETIITLFQLFLRPNEKLLCYADRAYSPNAPEGCEQTGADIIALTNRRLIRARIDPSRMQWKEVDSGVAVPVGMRAHIGHEDNLLSKWWIEDEPAPPVFFIDLPQELVFDEDETRSWEWMTVNTTWARMPLATLNAWSEVVRPVRSTTQQDG